MIIIIIKSLINNFSWLATGLYYMAELVEEYTVITCKLIYYLILVSFHFRKLTERLTFLLLFILLIIYLFFSSHTVHIDHLHWFINIWIISYIGDTMRYCKSGFSCESSIFRIHIYKQCQTYRPYVQIFMTINGLTNQICFFLCSCFFWKTFLTLIYYLHPSYHH